MSDFWSNPELARASNYVTFENAGDTITGVVTALRTQTFVDNGVSKTVPQIDMATADGPRTMTAEQIRLQMALLEHRPNIGDELTVTMTGVAKMPGGKTFKVFSVVVSKDGTIVEQTPAQAPNKVKSEVKTPDLGLI